MSGTAAARYVLAVDLGTSGAKVALIGIDGRVAAWEFEPVELIVLPGGGAEQRPEDWWRAAGRRDAAPARPPRRSGRRGRRRVLQHAERGHRAGRRGRRAAHELHPLDGHARRAAPAPAVRRAAEHAGHQPAAHPPMGEAHRRHALADRQGPRGPHALHPRRAAGGVRAHVQVPQRAGLPEPQAHRPHGRELRLDHDQLGDGQPRRGPREVRRRAGARLRHRRRQAAGDRQVHRRARPAHAGRGRGARAGAGDAGRRRRHRHHGSGDRRRRARTTTPCTCTSARRPGSPRTCRSRRPTCSRASRRCRARCPGAGCSPRCRRRPAATSPGCATTCSTTRTSCWPRRSSRTSSRSSTR